MASKRVLDQQINEQTQAMVRCGLVLVAVLLIGTLGFYTIERHWSLWESFYFTLVTITTVGYGDYGISQESQAFAAFLLLCGIGTFTYSLSTMIRIASDIDALKRRKMNQQIAKCNGHIIVCGYGRMGHMICDEIERGGLQCVIIECNPDQVEEARSDGRLVIEGIASEDEVLIEAGLERAQGIVCGVNVDAENLFITVTVHSINPNCQIISRAETPQAARKLRHAGASLVVSPAQMAGQTVATALLNPRLSRFLNTGSECSEHFELSEGIVESGSQVENKSVSDCGIQLQGVVFVAIEHADGTLHMQPTGDKIFREGDIVIFAGSTEAIALMQSALSANKPAEVAKV